ncbi:amino acid permease [Streptomyces sp. NBC_00988]|uniref:amino acid permease n=1 Tax=Streptomyces sp. NBC_00988 TaxID=2903704 RepID=UPI0038634028|nr:amino acid permease [Streptomyces sp. NBC_00988]
MGAFQVFTTVRKFIPLLFMATIGLLFIDPHNFGPFNASGQSAMGAIPAAAPIALFSHIGLEAASVVAGRVREPGRSVPRATVYGTLACAGIYILGTFAVCTTSPSPHECTTPPTRSGPPSSRSSAPRFRCDCRHPAPSG